MPRTLFCLARDYGEASTIVRDLELAGFPQNVISLLPSSLRGRGRGRFAASTKAPEGVAWGFGLGGLGGGLTGWLAGTGLLQLSALEPLVASGVFFAFISGVALGGTLGGLLGGLIGVGVPEIEVRPAPEPVADNYLVSVVVESDPGAGHVRKIFVRRGGRCISESAVHPPSEGLPRPVPSSPD
ncbi:MAG: DUF3341 domain-containing protein [Verrucomicrobia bacterium]|nr:DUF3341 domain-containing protein [Verrucomicrobiota bacterium]